ncbi:hypothetical protein CJJ18_03715 [Candidatus Williamhamiltonella defendens]|uniref:Uncharacterized protein n=1 Tax=Candidatus Williamhamiltonella defendens TaxID=138072 RepID=A0A2D3TDA5_9ENTR|nr:hypothetical protein [Candidatus Hamiltonella defensa]ASV33315.1 hypothetical protein CJJ18_03715 [Candidatus Hamiltonella defensa]ATW23113.1 hypothetical protein BJP44_08850 [Candidatus Hamiltonella defensa]ATW33693.1 hypothetical protein BJP43_04735 [Candidatus Hamiltonella defensa]AYB48265.1 hypothetical protein CJJ19_00485 [Candidatus Hamiltonella defensa]
MSLSIQGQNNGLYQKALHEKNIEHPIKNLLKKNTSDMGIWETIKGFFCRTRKTQVLEKVHELTHHHYE